MSPSFPRHDFPCCGIDTRILNEDYKRFALQARYNLNEYLGEIFRDGKLISQCELASLDGAMEILKSIADQIELLTNQ